MFLDNLCRLPGISRSYGRGQDLRNSLLLARVLISQIRPFKMFGLNLKELTLREMKHPLRVLKVFVCLGVFFQRENSRYPGMWTL